MSDLIKYEVRVYADGSKEWYLNDKLHRTDGPAVEWADGYKAWYLNGEPHREDGPAVECADGYKVWYLNGKLHREGGPAIEGEDGKTVEIDGVKYVLIRAKEGVKTGFGSRGVVVSIEYEVSSGTKP
jgi:hypothetical protein